MQGPKRVHRVKATDTKASVDESRKRSFPKASGSVHDGITFRIYRVNGMTLVFWQEGAMVCVLASERSTDEVVQLAYRRPWV